MTMKELKEKAIHRDINEGEYKNWCPVSPTDQ